MTPSEQSPPGVLPKKLNYIVLAVIAAVVLISTLFSGKKAQQQVMAEPVPAGPSQSQLTSFKATLERRSREAEEARLAFERKQAELAKQATTQPLPVAEPEYSAPDPIRERERLREATAPFASNLVPRPEEEQSIETIDRSSQFIAERKDERSAPLKGGVDAPNESGRFLPERVGNLFRLYEGATVETRLVNRLDGSFTGPVICVVERDVSTKSGEAVLIPKGAHFFGTATRVEAQNQARLAVAFKRLLFPNGYSVDLESAPGLDRVGETGLKDKVNNHRLRTFGVAGAIGLLGGFALYRGNPYAAGVANSTGSAGTQALGHFLNAVPTITIREGHEVLIYIPEDLLLPEYRPEAAERNVNK
jgi:type IV secretion system protein VirB10